jgi:hypothetical protein
MANYVHYSQRTAFERAQDREARRQSDGIRNRQGGVSFFRQGGNDKAPTPEEAADAVRFAHGVETTPHTIVRFGPDFSRVLKDVPDNIEAARPLHTGRSRG